jgi:[ribosomal protein S5]-alanine N-acetyltransferase
MSGVSIRRWSEADARDLAEMYARNREEIERGEPWRTPAHFTEAGQRDRLRRIARESPSFIGWVIMVDGVVAGTVGLDEVRDGRGTLGYWLDAASRGRGVATAAARLAVMEAFETLGLQRIVANTLPDNQPSIAVLRRLGFVPAGTVHFPRGGEHRHFVLERA